MFLPQRPFAGKIYLKRLRLFFGLFGDPLSAEKVKPLTKHLKTKSDATPKTLYHMETALEPICKGCLQFTGC
jgi:hypothetical protein